MRQAMQEYDNPITQAAPDLYALVIRLIAEKSGPLRSTQGHLAHGAFLDMLHQADPDVAKTVHDMHGRKPFTISPLEGFGHGRKGQIKISTGQEGWLRITLLDAQLFHTFISYFLQGDGRPTIRLDGAPFHISEVLGTSGSHQLAGAGSLRQLQDQWAAADLQDHHRAITLRFRSPTAFSLRGGRFRHMHVLPDSALVFGQLAGYWDRLTGNNTQETTTKDAEMGVAVARHDIKTHAYQFKQGVQIGFTGRVTYQFLGKENEELIRHLNRLADLAFFTGVGYKTTMGMGQVSRA